MKFGISDEGFRRLARPPYSLYHTTTAYGLQAIQETGVIKPKDYDSFVSFSADPDADLLDISGGDYRIEVAIPEGVMPVEYTEEWAEQYPDHARYIAGEGWEAQFEYSEDTIDEEGWEDTDLMEQEWNEAMIISFLYKDNEQEWISKNPGEEIAIQIINIEEL